MNPTTGAIKGHTCLQTGCAKCQEACPNDAIVTKEITVRVKGDFPGREKVGDTVKGYVLVVDEDACTNCGECYDVCPTDVIHEHPDKRGRLQVRPLRRRAPVHRLLPEPPRPRRRPQGRQDGPGAGGGLSMATVFVKLPVGMTTEDGRREVECDAATVGEALDKAIAVEPRLRPRIYREDGRMWAGVFLNGRNINAREGVKTPLEDGDKMNVVPPISGG